MPYRWWGGRAQEDCLTIRKVTPAFGTAAAEGVERALPSVAPAAVEPVAFGTAPRISSPGLLLSRLSQLWRQDPSEFRSVTAEIATGLAARRAADPSVAQFLGKLAEQFGQASESGDLAPLEPARPSWNPPATLPPNPSAADVERSVFAEQGSRGFGVGAVAEAMQAALDRVNLALGLDHREAPR